MDSSLETFGYGGASGRFNAQYLRANGIGKVRTIIGSFLKVIDPVAEPESKLIAVEHDSQGEDDIQGSILMRRVCMCGL